MRAKFLFEGVNTDLSKTILGDKYASAYDDLFKIDKSKNNKYLPLMSFFYTRGITDIETLKTIFIKINELESKNIIKSLQYTKKGIVVNNQLYKDFLTFSEYVDGLYNVHINKSVKPKVEHYTNLKPIFTNNIFDIYLADTPAKAIELGKGYKFCISQPSNIMWMTYRMQKESTFYFIYDKSRELNDRLHIVVYDNTNRGIQLTDYINTTNTIEDPFNKGNEISGNNAVTLYNKYLTKNGVNVNILKNIPKTQQEKEIENVVGNKLGYPEFKKLSLDYKIKYISYGHELTKEQFLLILPNKEVAYNYIISGNPLDYDVYLDINNNLKKSYLNARYIIMQHDLYKIELWEAVEIFLFKNNESIFNLYLNEQLNSINNTEIDYLFNNLKNETVINLILKSITDIWVDKNIKAWMIKYLEQHNLYNKELQDKIKLQDLTDCIDEYFFYNKELQDKIVEKHIKGKKINSETCIIVAKYIGDDSWKKFIRTYLHKESYIKLFSEKEKLEYLTERNKTKFHNPDSWEIKECERLNFKYTFSNKPNIILDNITKPELVESFDYNDSYIITLDDTLTLIEKFKKVFGDDRGVQLFKGEITNDLQLYTLNLGGKFLNKEQIEQLTEDFISGNTTELINELLPKDNYKLYFYIKYLHNDIKLEKFIANYKLDDYLDGISAKYDNLQIDNLDYNDFLDMCDLEEGFDYNDFENGLTEYTEHNSIDEYFNEENKELYNNLVTPLPKEAQESILKQYSYKYDEVRDEVLYNNSYTVVFNGDINLYKLNADSLLISNQDNFFQFLKDNEVNKKDTAEFNKHYNLMEYIASNKIFIEDSYLQGEITEILEENSKSTILVKKLNDYFTENKFKSDEKLTWYISYGDIKIEINFNDIKFVDDINDILDEFDRYDTDFDINDVIESIKIKKIMGKKEKDIKVTSLDSIKKQLNPELEFSNENKEELYTRAITVNESTVGGAGFAVYGGGFGGRGFGNSGGKFYGRGFGFGGSSNLSGGPNLMYTYSVKPLNKTLEPQATTSDDEQTIHVGSKVKGMTIDNKEIEGQISAIDKDENNNINWYIIIDENGLKQKVDPTSVFIVDYTDMVYNDEADLTNEGFYPNLY